MRYGAVDEEAGGVCDFEFPFSNDYDIINRTMFNWDDSYVTNNQTEYYRVPPELRAEGKLVCTHSFLEMVLCNRMASAKDQAQQVSLTQPGGGTDIIWKLSSMHSFLTYVAWMKSAESHGPSWAFYNWDDEDDIPHNEWLIDDLF